MSRFICTLRNVVEVASLAHRLLFSLAVLSLLFPAAADEAPQIVYEEDVVYGEVGGES